MEPAATARKRARKDGSTNKPEGTEGKKGAASTPSPAAHKTDEKGTARKKQPGKRAEGRPAVQRVERNSLLYDIVVVSAQVLLPTAIIAVICLSLWISSARTELPERVHKPWYETKVWGNAHIDRKHSLQPLIPFTTRDGAQLFYRKYGYESHTVVLCLADVATTSELFHPIAREMRRNTTFYALELRGFGATVTHDNASVPDAHATPRTQVLPGHTSYPAQLKDDLEDFFNAVVVKNHASEILRHDEHGEYFALYILAHGAGGAVALDLLTDSTRASFSKKFRYILLDPTLSVEQPSARVGVAEYLHINEEMIKRLDFLNNELLFPLLNHEEVARVYHKNEDTFFSLTYNGFKSYFPTHPFSSLHARLAHTPKDVHFFVIDAQRSELSHPSSETLNDSIYQLVHRSVDSMHVGMLDDYGVIALLNEMMFDD